jgi:SNF2 family DNA or RNA helicase
MSGKMSFSSREDQVKEFRDDEDIHVLISSLRTGGVGLDLSMANKCIMVDLWWNEAIQDQVSHRI